MNYEILEFTDNNGTNLAQAHGGYKSKILAIEEARSLFKRDPHISMIQVENVDRGDIVYEKKR